MADTQTKAGTTTTGTGLNSLDQAKQYWSNIMSGNKTAVASAAAPAVNAVNEQADAARSQQAEMGTARGGGVNAGNQAAETNRMATIDNITGQQQPAAAKSIESIGTTEAGIGQAQMAKALQSLGLSAEVANEIIDSSIKSRPVSIQANQAVAQQWSNALGALGL